MGITVNPLPDEYIEFLQCQMYGCTPTQLAQIPADTLEAHWFLYNEVRAIEKARADKNKKKPKAPTNLTG